MEKSFRETIFVRSGAVMPGRGALYSIVLAAGKGRRMRNQALHKVCFQIGGIPAIERALDSYNRVGVVRNVVVVGELAGQVVETVGKKFFNTVFAFQAEPTGTADAARCGLQALAEIDPESRLLIVAGDKIIDSAALARLIRRFEETDADLGLLVSPAAWGGESAGRVLAGDGGQPVAIVETADIRLRACRSELRRFLENGAGAATFADLQSIVARNLGRSGTLASVFEQRDFPGQGAVDARVLLERLAALPHDFRVPGEPRAFTAEETQAAPFRNESVYLVKKRAIDYGLEKMRSDNAQGESYLTDAIGEIFCAGSAGERLFRTCQVATETPFEVLSYNNPEELLR